MTETEGCGAPGPKGFGPCIRHVEHPEGTNHVHERQNFESRAGKWVCQTPLSLG